MVCGSHNHPRYYLIRHQGPKSHVVAKFPLLGNPNTVSLHTTTTIPNPLDRDTPIEISSRPPHIKVHPQPFPSLIKLVKLPGSSQFNRVRPNGAHNYDLMLVQRYCQAIHK